MLITYKPLMLGGQHKELSTVLVCGTNLWLNRDDYIIWNDCVILHNKHKICQIILWNYVNLISAVERTPRLLPSWRWCWQWSDPGCPGRGCCPWLCRVSQELVGWWAGCPVTGHAAASAAHWAAEPGPVLSAGWTMGTEPAAALVSVTLQAWPED